MRGGRLAKVGLGVSTDKRDTTTMPSSVAFVQNQGQNQRVKPVSGGWKDLLN